jgi:hypothetical protein
MTTAEEGIYIPDTEIGLNEFNKFSYEIKGNNSNLTILSNSETKILTNFTYLGYSITCLGNSNWGNLFLNLMLNETLSNPLEYFPANINSEMKYCIVNVGPVAAEDDEGVVILSFMLIDSDQFIPLQTTRTEDKGNGEYVEITEYYYEMDFKLLALGKVHTINKKYLGNI